MCDPKQGHWWHNNPKLQICWKKSGNKITFALEYFLGQSDGIATELKITDSKEWSI